jgi:hypothetical protein
MQCAAERKVPGEVGSSWRAWTCRRTVENDSILSAASACAGLKSFMSRVTCGCATSGAVETVDKHRPQICGKAGVVASEDLSKCGKRVKERRDEL